MTIEESFRRPMGEDRATSEPYRLDRLLGETSPKRLGGNPPVVRARRRQRLALRCDHADTAYVVRSGMLVMHAQVPGQRRQVLGIYYPGDVFRSASAPPLPEVALMAGAPSEALRMRWSAVESIAASEPAIATALGRQLARQQARRALQIAVIGALPGEERVASFLLELALHFGTASAGGIGFEMPLTRADVADYLALNPDTLSRIMSRLKAQGIVTVAGRGRVLANDWNALCRHSPIAESVIELHS